MVNLFTNFRITLYDVFRFWKSTPFKRYKSTYGTPLAHSTIRLLPINLQFNTQRLVRPHYARATMWLIIVCANNDICQDEGETQQRTIEEESKAGSRCLPLRVYQGRAAQSVFDPLLGQQPYTYAPSEPPPPSRQPSILIGQKKAKVMRDKHTRSSVGQLTNKDFAEVNFRRI